MRLEELVNPTGDATGVFDTGKFIEILTKFRAISGALQSHNRKVCNHGAKGIRSSK